MTEPTKSAPRDVIADVPDVWSNHSDYPMELGLGIHTADRIMDALAKAGYQIAAKAAEREAADPRTTLHTVISDIREASGLGGRPMLGELAGEIGKLRERAERAEAALAVRPAAGAVGEDRCPGRSTDPLASPPLPANRERERASMSEQPKRIQRKRTKGWKMPPNTVSVTRPGPFGNPAACTRPHNCARQRCECCPPDDYCCVSTFEEYVRSGLEGRPSRSGTLSIGLDALCGYPRRTKLIQSLPKLRGKNLACFCALDHPCHADVLLEIANAPPSPATKENAGCKTRDQG